MEQEGKSIYTGWISVPEDLVNGIDINTEIQLCLPISLKSSVIDYKHHHNGPSVEEIQGRRSQCGARVV